MDVIGASVALVLLSPVVAIVALLVRVLLGRPLLFRQVRPGLHAKPFEVLKFRTMTDATDQSGALLPDADRLTNLGRFLRRTSLDELPQLWNVLRGDMSLVGPRPLLMEYLDRYSPEQARRHQVKPGITGWAQISYTYGASIEDAYQKLKFDLYYIKNYSLILDFLTLIQTVRVVLWPQGVR